MVFDKISWSTLVVKTPPSKSRAPPFWRRTQDVGETVVLFTACVLLAPFFIPAFAVSECCKTYKGAGGLLEDAAQSIQVDQGLLDLAMKAIKRHAKELSAQDSQLLHASHKKAQVSTFTINALIEERAPGGNFAKIKRSKKVKMALHDERMFERLKSQNRALIKDLEDCLESKGLW